MSAQARMPPVRFDTLVKPACLRASAAFWLRAPDLQWTTTSLCFLSANSALRMAISPTGMSGAPRFTILYSCGSRTSRTKTSSLASSLRFNSSNGDLRNAVDDGQIAYGFVACDFQRTDFARRLDAAELVVVDELGDRRVGAADGAVGIFAQLQGAEAHAESIDQQQAADQRLADAENQLDGLGRLDDADEAGQNTKHAAFGAGGNKARRWRLRVEAAIAGAFFGARRRWPDPRSGRWSRRRWACRAERRRR